MANNIGKKSLENYTSILLLFLAFSRPWNRAHDGILSQISNQISEQWLQILNSLCRCFQKIAPELLSKSHAFLCGYLTRISSITHVSHQHKICTTPSCRTHRLLETLKTLKGWTRCDGIHQDETMAFSEKGVPCEGSSIKCSTYGTWWSRSMAYSSTTALAIR